MSSFNKRVYKLDYDQLREVYSKYLEVDGREEYKLQIKRYNKIIPMYEKYGIFVHQGRSWVRVLVSKYHFGIKAGCFALTKKPFNFRPKKKKR